MIFYRRFLAIGLCLIAGWLAGCDNPVENDDEHHPGVEVAGVILISDGEDLVRVEGGQLADTLFVPLEGALDVELAFLDEDGQRFDEHDLEEGLALAWEISGEPVVTVRSTGAWTFEVQGDESGETALRILLMHGDHHDFTTPDVTVVVG